MGQGRADAAPSGRLLSLSGVAKLYGGKLVFREVSLTVDAGSIWLLVGANGAGKSTLMSIMAGLSLHSAGRRELLAPHGRVGYLGHQTFIYPRLSARRNLAFWAALHGLGNAEAAIDAALTRVGLLAAAEELAGRFSRGMAQRLALARVFITEPWLLFLDEPGTGLDAASMRMLRAEVLAARERGAAVVMVSHQLASDLEMADHVLHLENRRAVYSGPAAGFDPATVAGRLEGAC